MRSLILAACIAASPAFAGDLVLANKEAGQELRLYERACTHAETLGLIVQEWRPKFRDARLRKSDGTILFYGCWLEQYDFAIVIFEDGDKLVFPLSAFSDPSI